MTGADAVVIFRQRLDGQQNIKEGAKIYRRKCLEALLKFWPDLESRPVGKVSKDDCLLWARHFAGGSIGVQLGGGSIGSHLDVSRMQSPLGQPASLKPLFATAVCSFKFNELRYGAAYLRLPR